MFRPGTGKDRWGRRQSQGRYWVGLHLGVGSLVVPGLGRQVVTYELRIVSRPLCHLRTIYVSLTSLLKLSV